MFEIIVEDNCEIKDDLSFAARELKPFLKSIVSSQKLESLKYFVVSANNNDLYKKSVEKYAHLLGENIYVLNDDNYSVAGKSLEGFNHEGEYTQAIVIKAGLIIAMYNDLVNKFSNIEKKDQESFEYRDVGLVSVLHEMGHAVDNANRYEIRGSINNKILYDLDTEFDEYVESFAYSLWGEYFAESFPYQIMNQYELFTKGKEEQLLECVKNYSTIKNRNAIAERVYRILYFFVHCLARVHYPKFERFNYESIRCAIEYTPFLERTEIAMLNLYKEYPCWNVTNCMNEMRNIIMDMIKFEEER